MLYIQDFALACALGFEKETIWNALKNKLPPKFVQKKYGEKLRYVAPIALENLPHVKNSFYENHVNRLSESVLLQMEKSIEKAVQEFGNERIGIFVGSSDNGSEASLSALQEFKETNNYPKHSRLKMKSQHKNY